MSETTLKCSHCPNGIYFIDTDNNHLSWLRADMVVLNKKAYCTGCKTIINAGITLSVLSTDLIYHAGAAYTTREFTSKFRLVVKSSTDVSLQSTEHNSKPSELNPKQIEELTQRFRIKISSIPTSETGKQQSSEDEINVGGTVSGNIVKGNNNKVTSTRTIHGLSISIIGNNINVEPV